MQSSWTPGWPPPTSSGKFWEFSDTPRPQGIPICEVASIRDKKNFIRTRYICADISIEICADEAKQAFRVGFLPIKLDLRNCFSGWKEIVSFSKITNTPIGQRTADKEILL